MDLVSALVFPETVAHRGNFLPSVASRVHALQVYPKTVPVDEDMWEQMYDDAGGVWNPNEGGTRTRSACLLTPFSRLSKHELKLP